MSNEVRSLGSRDVHVWCRCTELDDDPGASVAEQVLSEGERARRDRMRLPKNKRDYADAHDLLRRSLSRYAMVSPEDWQFVTDPTGKPQVRGGTLSFNLSHTSGLVACAITRTFAVGIDVERANRVKDANEVAEHFFSASEAAALKRKGSDAPMHFVEIWTLKEAFLKALGVGLSRQLNTFAFDLDEQKSRIRFAAPPGCRASEWQFALYAPSLDTRLAVATHSCDSVRWLTHEIRSDRSIRIEPIRTS